MFSLFMSCSNLLVRNEAIKYKYHAKISLEYLKQRSELDGNHCSMLLKRAEKNQCFASMHCTHVYNLFISTVVCFMTCFATLFLLFTSKVKLFLQFPRGISFPPCLSLALHMIPEVKNLRNLFML